MKEQEEWLRQHMQEQSSSLFLSRNLILLLLFSVSVAGEEEDLAPSLRVTWKAKKGDPSNGGYTAKILEDMFSKVNTRTRAL